MWILKVEGSGSMDLVRGICKGDCGGSDEAQSENLPHGTASKGSPEP